MSSPKAQNRYNRTMPRCRYCGMQLYPEQSIAKVDGWMTHRDCVEPLLVRLHDVEYGVYLADGEFIQERKFG